MRTLLASRIYMKIPFSNIFDIAWVPKITVARRGPLVRRTKEIPKIAAEQFFVSKCQYKNLVKFI